MRSGWFTERNKKDMSHPCFAYGYLNKIIEFAEETNKRETDKSAVINKIDKYIKKLQQEIKKFFEKTEEFIWQTI